MRIRLCFYRIAGAVSNKSVAIVVLLYKEGVPKRIKSQEPVKHKYVATRLTYSYKNVSTSEAMENRAHKKIISVENKKHNMFTG